MTTSTFIMRRVLVQSLIILLVLSQNNLYLSSAATYPDPPRNIAMQTRVSTSNAAETEIRLEVRITNDNKVHLVGKSFMKLTGHTDWKEFYNANIDITVKDPAGTTIRTITTKTNFGSTPTTSGFDEVVLDTSSVLMRGVWTFTAIFNGDKDYLPSSKTATYTYRRVSSPTTGVIILYVTDSDYASLVDVAVSIKGPMEYARKTDASGMCQVDDVPFGTYVFEFTLEGYVTKTFTKTTNDKNPNVQEDVILVSETARVREIFISEPKGTYKTSDRIRLYGYVEDRIPNLELEVKEYYNKFSKDFKDVSRKANLKTDNEGRFEYILYDYNQADAGFYSITVSVTTTDPPITETSDFGVEETLSNNPSGFEIPGYPFESLAFGSLIAFIILFRNKRARD